jgi:hypothetical protein
MRLFVRQAVMALAFLLAPLGQAVELQTLEDVRAEFSHAVLYDYSVSVLHDGWQISFLSPNGSRIGAILIRERKGSGEHERNLSELISQLATLTSMRTPESMEFEGEPASALLVDQYVISSLADTLDNVFEKGSLAAMVYLLNNEFFVIDGVGENGYLHWKTAKKSGVELRMPMGESRLSAIEVAGKQQMNEYAAAVLADKLGLGKSTVPERTRTSIARQMSVREVPYMNAREGVLLARSKNRAVIGKRQTVSQIHSGNEYGALAYPDESSEWPMDKEPEPVLQKDEKPEPVKEEVPLTPAAAREAYINHIRSL